MKENTCRHKAAM